MNPRKDNIIVTGIKICGTGRSLPKKIVTNKMMESIVDTSDEWIISRTGIRQRHIADGETNLSMASDACKNAMSAAGISPKEIAVVVCATVTNDKMFPSLACLLQRELSLEEELLAFDINASCSGFVYAIEIARSLLLRTPGKYALITGSEVLSQITDYTDRSTCVLFGDGAGAAVIKLDNDNPFFFISGAKADDEVLYCHQNRKKNMPLCEDTGENHESIYLNMNGPEVFRFAVSKLTESILNVLSQAGHTIENVDHLICHQANERIINSAIKKLGIAREKCFMNIEKYGNTSAASIPIALDELVQSSGLHRGESVLLAGFGGGLTYGCVYLIW